LSKKNEIFEKYPVTYRIRQKNENYLLYLLIAYVFVLNLIKIAPAV